jgi:uncharacterized Zn finger protein
MLKTQISVSKVNDLVQAMRDSFDPAILERGWQYYHKDRIRHLTVENEAARAVVMGNSPYSVILRLDLFGMSECSCPYEGFCKHMAAVGFSLYSPYGRPELLLQELKQYAANRSRRSAAMKARLQKPSEPVQTAPGDSPLAWRKYWEQQFFGFAMSHPHAVEDFYSAVLQRLEILLPAIPPGRRVMFRLHALLFILWKLDQLYANNYTTYLSYYVETGCRKVAEQCMGRLEETVSEAAVKEPRMETDLAETANVVRELSFPERSRIIEGIDVFRLLWSELLTGTERVLREREWIAREQSHEPEESFRRRQLTLAAAHFDVQEGRDEQALGRLAEAGARDVSPCFWYLRLFHRTGQWERLHRWLRWLLPFLHSARQDQFRVICGYWNDMAARSASDEEWVAVMESLLPRSYAYYTDYLMKTRRYRQWVDLQMANRLLPANLYSAELKAVTAHDPALLLPLYHQAAERYIQEKNRNAYKAAVRTMKKLQSFYKKLKRLDRWEEYIAAISGKYSRLRAFQEELRKGKLLP